ncbi:PAS domain S-box protein [candidate division KSB1 bacterium]|nr:PAS domain S-box protein [candidate division KSB1 bacterium]
MHVLIIEEENQAVERVVQILEQAGLLKSWKQAANSQQFLALLDAPVDCILSSEGVTDLSCLQALKLIQSRRLDVPFILLTVHDNHQVAIECLKRGADDCVYRDQLGRLPAAVGAAVKKAAERSKQKRLEKALMITKFAVDHAAMAMYWIGLDGRLMWVNGAGLKLLGCSTAEINQIRIEMIDPALTDSNWNEFVGALRATNSHVHETRFQRKNGHFLPVEVTANLFETDGREYLLLFALDITQRKAAEREHSRLVTAVEQAAESIVITDVKGRILYVNPAFESISGYSRDEVLGKSTSLIKSGRHPRVFYNELWGTLTSGESWHGRFINRRKDGSLFEEEATISPIKDQQGQIINFVAVKRDVTHEVDLEKQFIQSQKMEAIGRLAGGVAHDFNNLLTVINGYCELMLSQVDARDPLHSNIEQINKSVQKGANLTRQLLAFSRQEPLEAKVIDLNRTIAELSKLMKRMLGEDIELETRLDSNAGNIKADPGQIEQIIVNLAVNAREAMPQGGKLILRTEPVELDEAYCRTHLNAHIGEHVLFTVSDTGIGMTEEVQLKIFDPFFTTKKTGTGLGLSTVFGIVSQYEGHIECESELEKGTKFKIFLPRVTEPVQDIPEKQALKTLPRGEETILLVEDEEDVKSLAARMLRLQGYRVLEAQHGGEALLTCEQFSEPIDLLITDVIMPQMSGSDLAKRLQKVKPAMKVLYMSGYASNILTKDHPDKTDLAFMPKPFTLQQIAHKVREVLDSGK